MNHGQLYLVLDYETRSECELKKCGSFEYSVHPTTKILCAAWRVGTREELRREIREKIPPKVLSPAFPNLNLNSELTRALFDPSITLIAHNAYFEQVITRNVLLKTWETKIPHERWICTAAMAAAVALPRKLEGACLALNLPIQKDMEGRRLMMKYSKPRKPTKNNPAKWHAKKSDLLRIMEYCKKDVDAETLLFLSIPELSAKERQVWLLDQRINFRGFLADRELVTKVLGMVAEETALMKIEAKELITDPDFNSVNQREYILEWLDREGVHLPDLKARTVKDVMATKLPARAKRILEIRQAVSKTSTAKYHAFDQRSRFDGRVRDILVYHTASTGRWGGAGVQPQNFPRGSIPDTITAAEVLRDGDLELVRMIYGNPMEVFSSCLRSVIKAPEGRELFCADYAAIEARVLFWMAHHKKGVDSFFAGAPMYEQMAAAIYGVPIDKVTKPQRQVGKQAFLGCGYGMGPPKFRKTCDNFGIEIPEGVEFIAVEAYRTLHRPVQLLWGTLERCAITAVQNPGRKFKVHFTTWWVKDGFLWCELPSGRRLAYYGPKIMSKATPWGEKRPALYHWGVDPLTRKWVFGGTYGGKLVENCVQGISRDFLAEAMLRIEAAGYDIILSVHDELVAERNCGLGSLNDFEALMENLPTWGSDCPIKVEGWVGGRYKK